MMTFGTSIATVSKLISIPCNSAGLVPEPARELPESEQEETIRGVKCGLLELADNSSKMFTPAIRFRGVGYHMYYGMEDYAVCGNDCPHPVPNLDPQNCGCGFWLPDNVNGIVNSINAWLLDVELAGKVIKHEHGWRGQWQRVLAVTPPLWCHECFPQHCPATCLDIHHSMLVTRCRRHAPYPVPKPLSWLRSILQTEVRPGFLTDDSQPPGSAGLSPDALQQVISAVSGAAAAAAGTPGLVPGRVWKYYIAPGVTDPRQDAPMVMEIRATGAGLLMQLSERCAGGLMRVLWTENMPV